MTLRRITAAILASTMIASTAAATEPTVDVTGAHKPTKAQLQAQAKFRRNCLISHDKSLACDVATSNSTVGNAVRTFQKTRVLPFTQKPVQDTAQPVRPADNAQCGNNVTTYTTPGNKVIINCGVSFN